MQQFLRLLNPSFRQPRVVKSIQLTKQLVSPQVYQNYSKQIRNIYQHFFNENANVIQIKKVMVFQIKKTKVPICNKTFSKTQQIYRCYDCFIHQAAVLCVDCFQNGEHKGHRFKKISSGGGNCDCGNPKALLKQAFCINHSGVTQIPEIPENQEVFFNQIFNTLFQWFFQLIRRKQSMGQPFLVCLVEYLNNLNKQSVYYNVLTFRLLTKRISKDNCYLDQIFKLKGQRVCLSFNQLYFSMFSLQQFKMILADKYLTAYNTIQRFQNTQFHSLYIQLFANDDVIFNIVNKFKNTIFVTKPEFNFQTYLQDINFISSIGDQPAFAFYQIYFSRNKCIPCKILDEIQQKLEKSQQMHLVDLVSKNISNQNSYYFLHSELFKKIKKNHQLIVLVLGNLFNMAMSKQYSYRKNKAILPYHRMYALGLLAAFQGNMQRLSLQQISGYLRIQPEHVLNFYRHNIPIVLNCLFDFAETYARRNYFDNYIVLYARSGLCCINYDFLFIKQAANVYRHANLNFQQILTKMFNQTVNNPRYKSKQPKQNQAKQELIKTWIYFYQLLIQLGVTCSSEIINSQRLKIQSQILKQQRRNIFRSMIRQIGSVTREQLKIIQRYFLHNLDDNFLSLNAQFNKSTKKYYIEQNPKMDIQQQKQSLDFDYNFYISKRKTGLQLFKQTPMKMTQLKKYSIKENSLIQTMITSKVINNFTQYIKSQTKQNQKQKQSIFNTLYNLYKKLVMCKNQKQRQEYDKLRSSLEEALPDLQIANGNNKQKINQQDKQRLRKLKQMQNEKKKKFLAKQNNTMSKLKKFESNEMSMQDQLVCILCRDNKKNQNLCYFSYVKLKRLYNQNNLNKNADSQLKFIYNSCFHTTHYSCFNQFCNGSLKMTCPLCKSYINILLPIDTQYFDQTFNKAIKRLNNILITLQRRHQWVQYGETIQYEQIFLSIFGCFCQYIGFVGVCDHEEFDKKLWRVCKQLVNTLFLLWKSISNSKQDQIRQLIDDQLSLLSKQGANQKQQIIRTIKYCIFNSCKQVIILGKQLQSQSLFKKYGTRINTNNLIRIKHNLQLVLSNSNKIMSQDLSNIMQNEVTSIQKLYTFYQPPRTPIQLIKLRDQISEKSCKNGHNICYCCQCSEIVCKDCKTMEKHYKKHGCQSMYFSILTGGIVFSIPRQVHMQSLYQNKFGSAWTSDKAPQGYIFNEELYNKLTHNLAFHTIQNLIRSQFPKVLEEGVFAEFQ